MESFKLISCSVTYFKVKTVALRADRKWIAQIDVWSFYEHWARAKSDHAAQSLVQTCQRELGSVKLTEKDHFISINYNTSQKRRVTRQGGWGDSREDLVELGDDLKMPSAEIMIN